MSAVLMVLLVRYSLTQVAVHLAQCFIFNCTHRKTHNSLERSKRQFSDEFLVSRYIMSDASIVYCITAKTAKATKPSFLTVDQAHNEPKRATCYYT
jgi:hypothetical protein